MENIQWLAGFFDGDGHIGIQKNNSGTFIRVEITNTEQDLLTPFKEKFGGKYYTQKRKKTKDVFHWRLNRDEIEYFVNEISPHIQSIKKQKIFVLIKEWFKYFKKDIQKPRERKEFFERYRRIMNEI